MLLNWIFCCRPVSFWTSHADKIGIIMSTESIGLGFKRKEEILSLVHNRS